MSATPVSQPFHVATGTEAEVCRDIAIRQGHGIGKYGTTVADNPLELREWLQHAYEESLDKAIYLKRAIQEIDEKAAPQIARPQGIADGHNPGDLLVGEVGVEDGWRLLTGAEIESRSQRRSQTTKCIQCHLTGGKCNLTGGKWDSSGWIGSSFAKTYRTKMPAGYYLTN